MSKPERFAEFLGALEQATESIDEGYFYLRVTYQPFVYRERAYCYELYRQLRRFLPADFPYVLHGEVDKSGYHAIVEHCGPIIPDFLVHDPGHMGPDDNLVIMEVKSVTGANYNNEEKGLLKDIDTINCMTAIENGYYRGVILIYGSDHNDKKAEIREIVRTRCPNGNVLLLFHEAPGQRSRIITH